MAARPLPFFPFPRVLRDSVAFNVRRRRKAATTPLFHRSDHKFSFVFESRPFVFNNFFALFRKNVLAKTNHVPFLVPLYELFSLPLCDCIPAGSISHLPFAICLLPFEIVPDPCPRFAGLNLVKYRCNP